MLVNEIFTSIQGEGFWTGIPATFIRLQGCNLRCDFCDTKKTWPQGDGIRWTPTQVACKVRSLGLKDVIITGGEPLLQQNTVAALVTRLGPGYRVHVETNGTLEIIPVLVDELFWVTVSPKRLADYEIQPGLFDRMNEIKFIVTCPNDLDAVTEHLKAYGSCRHVCVQPVDNRPDVTQICVAYVIATNDPRLRLSMQVHKFIGIP